MKLDQSIITFLQGTVKTAKLVGIENIVIESDCVRAIDNDKTVLILQKTDIPSLPFESIGINDLFLSRLDIIKTYDNFALDVQIDNTEKYALSIKMKGKGTAIDYRCRKPSAIQAPRCINDEPNVKVFLNGEAVLLLQKGMAAMSADCVTITCNSDDVSFEILDVNNDKFAHVISNNIIPLSEDSNTKFAHKYIIKKLLPLFKQNPEGSFEIGKNGSLKINVNGLDFYILPRI